jgi:hypothetical protein
MYLETHGDTIIPLAERVELEGYCVGVTEIHGQIKNANKMGKPYYLCADITEDVFVNSLKIPCICQITLKPSGVINTYVTKNVTWLRISRRSMDKIRLYICDDQGKIVSVGNEGVYCTLVFKRRRYVC